METLIKLADAVDAQKMYRVADILTAAAKAVADEPEMADNDSSHKPQGDNSLKDHVKRPKPPKFTQEEFPNSDSTGEVS